MTPAEKYRALLTSVGPALDMAQGLADASRAQMYALFTPDVAARMWDRWLAAHAGKSLLAQLKPDGTVRTCQELPTAEAERYAAFRDDAVIIATWDGA